MARTLKVFASIQLNSFGVRVVLSGVVTQGAALGRIRERLRRFSVGFFKRWFLCHFFLSL